MKSIKMNKMVLQRFIEESGKRLRRWKHYLPLLNLSLLVGVIGLAVVCVLLVYYPPVLTIQSIEEVEIDAEKQTSLTLQGEDVKSIDQYDDILIQNPFSPERQVWNSPIKKKKKESFAELFSKAQDEAKKVENQKEESKPKEKPKEKPKKITLQGILIFGDTKKAMIANPDKNKSKKAYVFIEEGEDVIGYKVKTIEEDRIKLDWYGEEHIIVMRSSIKK